MAKVKKKAVLLRIKSWDSLYTDLVASTVCKVTTGVKQ